MKIKLLWAVIAVFIALVVGYILGVTTWPKRVTNGTNTNVSFKIVTNNIYLSVVEQQELGMIISNVKNTRFVNKQAGNSIDVTFLFDYRLTEGKLIPFSYSEKVYLADPSGWIVGGGWDIVRGAPAALIGYHWRQLAILGTLTISTNLGIAVFAAWLF